MMFAGYFGNWFANYFGDDEDEPAPEPDTGGSGKKPPTRNAYRPKKPRRSETMRIVIFAYGYDMATAQQ
jgi:hypothetical protein